jgi:hypothetical protein
MSNNTAVQEILSMFNHDELMDIANHGCDSGCAPGLIYYHETVDFFNKFESEIGQFLTYNLGDDYLHQLSKGCEDMITLKNKLVWCFAELVARIYEDN